MSNTGARLHTGSHRLLPLCIALLCTTAVQAQPASEITVNDLVEGYDRNLSLVQNLRVTYTFRRTPTPQGLALSNKIFHQRKELVEEQIAAGHPPVSPDARWNEETGTLELLDRDGTPLRDDNGNVLTLDTAPEEEVRYRIGLPRPLRAEEISHRYVQKGTALRSYENGEVSDDGTFVSEFRVSTDAGLYKTISADKQGSILGTYSFDGVILPHHFLLRFWDPGLQWPECARPESAQVNRTVIAGSETPAEMVPTEVTSLEGVHALDGHKLYRISHSTMDPYYRVVLTVDVDPQRGCQAIQSEYEAGMRYGPDEDYVPYKRVVLDQVRLHNDPDSGAWYPTHARLRAFHGDVDIVQAESRDPRLSVSDDLVLSEITELITHEIAVNEDIPDAYFRIEYPEGYLVHDSVTGRSVVVGGDSTDARIRKGAQILHQMANTDRRADGRRDAGPVAHGPTTGPRIEFDRPSRDLGPVQYSKRIVHADYSFRNTGDEPLEIKEIKPGCGCTGFRIDQQVYAPGEKGRLDITVDIESGRGDFESGAVVLSNDATTPAVPLDFRCFVIRDIETYPDVLSFGTLDVRESRRGAVRVRLSAYPPAPPPRILAVRSSVGPLQCEVAQPGIPVEGGVVFAVTYELEPPLPTGELEGRIEVDYDAFSDGTHSIEVSGHVCDGITALPASVSFGFVTSDGGVLRRVLTLRSLREGQFRLEEARCGHPALTIEQLASARLGILLDPRKLPGPGEFTLSIYVRSKDGGTITIPVHGHLLDQR
ncbi:MAG TPA: DUF1573 domain-containing protein [Phycisphaerae bacterium]|nr:DUF1573 domain-containing protein [Phycisphaerae bacterium]